MKFKSFRLFSALLLPASALTMMSCTQKAVIERDESENKPPSNMHIDRNVIDNLNMKFENMTKSADQNYILNNLKNASDTTPEINDEIDSIIDELNIAFDEYSVSEEAFYNEIDLIFAEIEDGLKNETESFESFKKFVLYNWIVSVPIDVVVMTFFSGVYFAWAGVKLVGKFWGKKLAEKLSKSLLGIFYWVSYNVVYHFVPVGVNIVIGSIGNTLLGGIWAFSSIGNLFAYTLDLFVDFELNGIIWQW